MSGNQGNQTCPQPLSARGKADCLPFKDGVPCGFRAGHRPLAGWRLAGEAAVGRRRSGCIIRRVDSTGRAHVRYRVLSGRHGAPGGVGVAAVGIHFRPRDDAVDWSAGVGAPKRPPQCASEATVALESARLHACAIQRCRMQGLSSPTGSSLPEFACANRAAQFRGNGNLLKLLLSAGFQHSRFN